MQVGFMHVHVWLFRAIFIVLMISVSIVVGGNVKVHQTIMAIERTDFSGANLSNFNGSDLKNSGLKGSGSIGPDCIDNMEPSSEGNSGNDDNYGNFGNAEIEPDSMTADGDFTADFSQSDFEIENGSRSQASTGSKEGSSQGSGHRNENNSGIDNMFLDHLKTKCGEQLSDFQCVHHQIDQIRDKLSQLECTLQISRR